MGLIDIGNEAANEASDRNESSGSGGEFEKIDVSGMDFVKPHPGPTAIKATVTDLRGFSPAPDENGNYSDDDRGWAGLILEDLTIPEDEDFEAVAAFENTTETGDDFKIVNTDDDSVDEYDVGISVGGMFESEKVDDLGDGPFVLKTSTSAGRSIVRTLDRRGLDNLDLLRTEDGEIEIQDNGYPTTNDALVETHPDNDSDNYTAPRYSREPQIRPDVEGQEIVIILQHLKNVKDDYEGRSHWATVLASLDPETQDELAEEYANSYHGGDEPEDFLKEVNGEEMIRLAPTMEFDVDEDLLVETQWVEWAWPSPERTEELREEQGVTVD